MTAVACQEVPRPERPVAIVGEAASEVAAWLAARGADVQLTDRRAPKIAEIAAAGLIARSSLPDSRHVRPQYTEPPAVRSRLREDRAAPVP